MKLAAAAVLAALLAGCGASSAAPPRLSEAKPPVAKRLLAARLRTDGLAFHWVACVRTGRAFEGVPVVRCNVDFGDPHIEAYCAVLRDGRLVTNHEDAAIPCRHDEAGQAATIVAS